MAAATGRISFGSAELTVERETPKQLRKRARRIEKQRNADKRRETARLDAITARAVERAVARKALIDVAKNGSDSARVAACAVLLKCDGELSF